ncbi:MAG: ornithine carbamoyltransferase [Longibaculum sp.]
MVNLKGRSFLTLKDYSKEEIRYLLDLAHQLKKAKTPGRIGKTLEGKNIVLLFEKTSTRTRCAFEVAALDEGGHVTFLSNSQMGKKESIEDTAKVLGRMYDAIEFRGFKQETVEDLMKYSGVPVYNGLTDVDHPTQTLADFLTIEEHLNKPLNEVKFVFTGDIRNNVCYGLMYGAAKMGMHFVCLGPKSLQIDPEVLAYCQQEAMKSGGKIEVLDNVDEAVKGADVIYTDIWVSMGEDESLYKPRVEMLSPYKVTMEMMKKTGQDSTLFMHCLPSFHDFETEVAKAKNEQGIDIREVEDEVFRSAHSVVFDEAENRMHTIKAVMVATLGNNIDL